MVFSSFTNRLSKLVNTARGKADKIYALGKGIIDPQVILWDICRVLLRFCSN
jgi:hypothetical protein